MLYCFVRLLTKFQYLKVFRYSAIRISHLFEKTTNYLQRKCNANSIVNMYTTGLSHE